MAALAPDQPKRSSGYAKSPWCFSGRALYQLHLVKAKTARHFIPPELRLVEAFGYTLGGLFLAHYDESPVGGFDELVVVAGIVWNRPTSCAWAARVLVNNVEACEHGRKAVGLPSRVASFIQSSSDKESQSSLAMQTRSRHLSSAVMSIFGKGDREKVGIDIIESGGNSQSMLCNIALAKNLVEDNTRQAWCGPSITLSLPSFSGKTREQPHLLKYSCKLSCRVAVVPPACIFPGEGKARRVCLEQTKTEDSDSLVLELLTARPLCAIAFKGMVMKVEPPVIC